MYRALEHGNARSACLRKDIMGKLPQEIQDFGHLFVSMKTIRHKADYDPLEKYYKSSVKQDIAATKDVIRRFKNADVKDRRAFAAYVLFKRRND